MGVIAVQQENNLIKPDEMVSDVLVIGGVGWFHL